MMRPLGRWVLVAGAEAVLWLASPGYPPWAIASGEGLATVVFALARLALMAVAAYWLLLLSAAALGVVSVSAHVPSARAFRFVTGSWLIAATPVSPAAAAPGTHPSPGPAPVLIAPGAPMSAGDAPRHPFAPTSTLRQCVTLTPRSPRPARRVRSGPREAAGRQSWTVRPGDNLWVIAAAVVTAHLGRSPSDQEVAPYWLSVIAANRSRLPDPADPGLLFPGDTVLLPSPGTLLSWPAGS